MAADDREAARFVFARAHRPAAAAWSKSPPTKPASRSARRHDPHSRRSLRFQSARHRDRRRRRHPASTCSIHGKTRRAASTSTPCRSSLSSSTNSRSPTPSSSSSSMPLTTPRAIQAIFCATGRMETIPQGWDNRPGHMGFARRRARLRGVGRQAPARTSGSGSSPRRAPTADPIPGATIGSPLTFPHPTPAAPCAAPILSTRTSGRKPLRRLGPGWQRLAMDRRI